MTATDLRRAAALAVHVARSNQDGIDAIVAEARGDGDPDESMRSLLIVTVEVLTPLVDNVDEVYPERALRMAVEEARCAAGPHGDYFRALHAQPPARTATSDTEPRETSR